MQQDMVFTGCTGFTQSGPEERANAASHALAGVLAVLAWPALGQPADAVQPPLRAIGLQVFVASMLLMYLVSAACHAAPVGAAKHWLRRCDHAAIFVFIAGSSTPFALAAVQQGGSAATLVAVWGSALAGVLLKLGNRLRHRLPSTLLYLGYGWLVAALVLPALAQLPAAGWRLLVAGGVAYTLGSVFFLLDRRLPYSHLVWHLLVVAGSACHLLAAQTLP